MSELKTLKDLGVFTKYEISSDEFVGIALQTRTGKASKKGLACKVDINPTFVYASGLRQEAIKYAKKRFNNINHHNLEDWVIIDGKFGFHKKNTLTENDFGRLCEIGFIVWFFNITEEDLK